MTNSPSADLLKRMQAPGQTQRVLPFARANSQGISAWLCDLPRANLGSMSKSLYNGLTEINRTLLGEEERLQILDTLWPDIERIVDHLCKQFLRSSVILDGRRRTVLKLCQAMFQLLAEGYMIVVRDVLLDTSRADTAARAIHSAIATLGKVLLLSGTTYTPPPKNTWLRMNTLFQLAETRQLAAKAFQCPGARIASPRTIEEIYLRPVLLATLNTNRLRSAELMAISHAMLAWASHSAISRADDAAIFAINLNLDRGPDYLERLGKKDPESLRYVSTLPLSRLLRDALAEQDAHTGNKAMATQPKAPDLVPADLPRSLLPNVARAWSYVVKREHDRLPDNDACVNVGLGMACCHFWLSGGLSFPETLGTQTPTPPTEDNRPGYDVWEDVLDVAEMHSDDEIDFMIPPGRNEIRSETVPKAFQLSSLKIINSSPGGYCLRWHSPRTELLQVGELLCLKDHLSSGYSVAVIRWMAQGDEGIDLGVEIISSSPAPVAVKRIRRDGEPSAFLRGLLIPASSNVGRPASLLVSRSPFHEGDRVHVLQNGCESSCRLTQWISGSSSWCQYVFESTQHSMPEVPAAEIAHKETPDAVLAKQVKSPEKSEFDDLWDQL
jgi:hypothetical protein